MGDFGQALSEAVQTAALAAVGPARLSTYLGRANGDLSRALDYYHFNLLLSGATYETTALVEVALRNAMDSQLKLWNARQIDAKTSLRHSAEWSLDPAPLLRRLLKSDITKAKRRFARSRNAGGGPTHDDLVAQLDFSTWRYLFPDGDVGRQYLWTDALSLAFPALAGSIVRLVRSVDGIYRHRNRVAHLEPILTRSQVRNQLRSMRFVMRSINPALEEWLNAASRVDAVLADAPDRMTRK
ncbi:MAG: hypothetical protein LBU05_05365 [Bifidobacteriaceae bacterium]|nr:hypothetical protein [Bifidobacteriaceae bacterium]